MINRNALTRPSTPSRDMAIVGAYSMAAGLIIALTLAGIETHPLIKLFIWLSLQLISIWLLWRSVTTAVIWLMGLAAFGCGNILFPLGASMLMHTSHLKVHLPALIYYLLSVALLITVSIRAFPSPRSKWEGQPVFSGR